VCCRTVWKRTIVDLLLRTAVVKQAIAAKASLGRKRPLKNPTFPEILDPARPIVRYFRSVIRCRRNLPRDESIMTHPQAFLCRRGLIGLTILMGMLAPGCAWERPAGEAPDMSRVVQRPTYAVEGTRPLYLGGYAGAYYGPSLIGGR
jgi:hypothetical protein